MKVYGYFCIVLGLVLITASERVNPTNVTNKGSLYASNIPGSKIGKRTAADLSNTVHTFSKGWNKN